MTYTTSCCPSSLSALPEDQIGRVTADISKMSTPKVRYFFITTLQYHVVLHDFCC